MTGITCSLVIALSITQLEDLGEALLDFSQLTDMEIWLQDDPQSQ